MKLQARLIDKEKPVYVGVSGGVDSIVVAHLLHKLRFNFTIVHVNHQMIDADCIFEQKVKEFADNYNIQLIVYKDSIVEKDKESSEAYARNIRVDVWNTIAEKQEFAQLILAHQLDEAVESHFMNFLKGQEQYFPIPIISYFGEKKNLKVIRPALLITKAEMRDYSRRNNLNVYVLEDPMNSMMTSRRNVVRHKILPMIHDYYPGLPTVVRKKIKEKYEELKCQKN